MKKLLYVELSTAHTEIIYSTLKALEDNFEVTLLIHEQSIPRVKDLPARFLLKSLGDQNYLEIFKQVYNSTNPQVVLFNSTQGRKVRNIILNSLFKKALFAGFHHNPENLYFSFTQKLINIKIKKYIVLADFIKTYLNKLKGLQVESFYPLKYFDQNIILPDNQFKYFLVPGVLELARRDYLGLIDLIHQHNHLLPIEYKFVLLGNSQNHDGLRIVDKIKSLKLEDRFVLFNEYVLDPVLLGYVKSCVGLLPLITPQIQYFHEYFETKISGTYNLAYSFKKPLLFDEIFKDKSEFDFHKVLYNQSNFVEILKSAENQKIPHVEKFEFQFQKEKLIRFLNQ